MCVQTGLLGSTEMCGCGASVCPPNLFLALTVSEQEQEQEQWRVLPFTALYRFYRFYRRVAFLQWEIPRDRSPPNHPEYMRAVGSTVPPRARLDGNGGNVSVSVSLIFSGLRKRVSLVKETACS
mgnify:CR=1 FL=1